MGFLIVLAALMIVVLVVSAPLRRERGDRRLNAELAELVAAQEAKYREIRAAELDHRTGKLSDADYGELDRTLRSEAIEILRAMDDARGDGGAGGRNGNHPGAATIPPQ